jgi:hypothetical protein
MRAAATGTALALAAALAAPATPGPDVYGTYRLQGRARVDARPFPAADQEVRADAVLSPGARAGEVRIHLAAQGFACELAASRDAGGTLALPPGQRCAADLRSDEAEGHVEARLVAGSGSARGEVLELALDFALSGSVRARPGGTLDALGQVFSLPGAGRDPVPVRGEASGRAEGRRDRSKAAQ